MKSSRKKSSTNSTRSRSSSVRNVGLRLLMGLVIAVVMFSLFLTPHAGAQGEPCSQCGPGAHWVDSCSAGYDSIASTQAYVGIDSNLNCVGDIYLDLGPCSAPDNLLIISRSAPRDTSQNFSGLRPLDGHLDVIDTEILSMCLTGGGITLKAGLGQGSVISKSLGAIAEVPGDPTRAESFFDVFFEVDLGGGFKLYNHIPLRVEVGPGGITCAPPKATDYFHPTGCIPLYTHPHPDSGMHVANLVTAKHVVNPSPLPSSSEWGRIVLILGLLTIGIWLILWRRRAVKRGVA